MVDAGLKALGEEVEAAADVRGALADRVAQTLRHAGHAAPDGFASVDAVLRTVTAVLPGWAVTMDGQASTGHGHWTCTVRRSRARDNDEAVGVGHGDHPAPALLGALLKALAAGARP